MSDKTSKGGGSAGIDLSQFYQVFFEEAGENLERMEQLLLALDVGAADDEELNAIFRCAHSIKGGAATFGFSDVAELTHQMETLLDKLRRHELKPNASMVDVLLAAGDALSALLARHQRGGSGDAVDTSDLLADIRDLVAGKKIDRSARVAPSAPAAPVKPAKPAVRAIELRVGPLDRPANVDGILELFQEIEGLGTIEPLDAGFDADGIRRFRIVTTSSDDDLLDLFSFHVSREQVKLMPDSPGYGFYSGAPAAPEQLDDREFGFFDGAPGAPGESAFAPLEAAEPQPLADAPATPAASAAGAQAASAASTAAATPAKGGGARGSSASAAASADATTLRVSIDKVDQLINLVGELVITQSMLAEVGAALDPSVHQSMINGLTELSRNTRDLQQAVMSIRMIPMSLVFNRFPRMLRDLAAKLGKKVDFVTQGEATELDKGLVEKITDPLTHLVRNACDHGIEMPADRLACGKPETGTLTLAAAHEGGSIVIEVKDDGRGLNRQKLLRKARERGIDAPDTMTDADVWGLIFAPGFSTAEVVTDVSGRGVGMDVVKKNITALGGTVEIQSVEGRGMSVKVRLPLTLAIMDSMSVGVGDERYILPLSQVVESFQFTPDRLKTIGGQSAQVVQVREDYLPVVELERLFDVPRNGEPPARPIIVIVEAEGARSALVVDELLGQQQVVVKNLEANYRKVQNVSGATIMGDGSVALILDIAGVVRQTRH